MHVCHIRALLSLVPRRILSHDTRKKGKIVTVVKTYLDEKKAQRDAQREAERERRNAAHPPY